MQNIDIATALIITAELMLEDEIRLDHDPLTIEQITDIIDRIDDIIEMIENIGI